MSQQRYPFSLPLCVSSSSSFLLAWMTAVDYEACLLVNDVVSLFASHSSFTFLNRHPFFFFPFPNCASYHNRLRCPFSFDKSILLLCCWCVPDSISATLWVIEESWSVRLPSLHEIFILCRVSIFMGKQLATSDVLSFLFRYTTTSAVLDSANKLIA